MIVEIGHFALVLALMVALVQMVAPAWGARTGDVRLMQMAAPAAMAQLSGAWGEYKDGAVLQAADMEPVE